MSAPIPYVDRQPDEPLLQYLMRILTAIVHAQGSVKIPLSDLVAAAEARGFVKTWDKASNSLILTPAPEHSDVFFFAQDGSVTTSSPGQSKSAPPKPPLPSKAAESSEMYDLSAETPLSARRLVPNEDKLRAERHVRNLLHDETLANLEHQRATDRELRAAGVPKGGHSIAPFLVRGDSGRGR